MLELVIQDPTILLREEFSPIKVAESQSFYSSPLNLMLSPDASAAKAQSNDKTKRKKSPIQKIKNIFIRESGEQKLERKYSMMSEDL